MKNYLLTLLMCLPLSVQAQEWRLAFVGDVMLGSDYPAARLPPGDGVGLMKEAHTALQWAHLSFGNLEGTLASGGVSSKQGCGKCYAFRTPPSYAKRLSEAGFNAMSQANNHGNDFGDHGRMQTTHALASVGIASSGWEGSSPGIMEHEGRRACLLAFAPNRGMNDLRNIPGAGEKVRQARKQCHLVVVSFHGGAEGSDKTRTPTGTETHLGENRGNVRLFARTMIDAGADIVYGHGPHVPRGMELYRGHLIAYSLGNFMTYGGMAVSGTLGQAPLLAVRLDKEGHLVGGRIISFRQSPYSPLKADPQAGAWNTIRARTQEDFAGGGMVLGDDATFWPAPLDKPH
jgi:hypothetical protein